MSTDFLDDSYLFTGLSKEAKDFLEDNERYIKALVQEAAKERFVEIHLEINRGEVKNIVSTRVIEA